MYLYIESTFHCHDVTFQLDSALSTTKTTTDTSVQTKPQSSEVRCRWNALIWLVCLKMLATDSPQKEPEETLATAKQRDCKEQGTMTLPQPCPVGPQDDQRESWWEQVMRAGADEARLWQFRRELRIPLPQLLATVSEVYLHKIVSDEVDDREGNDRHSLVECMHTFFLRREGAAHAARAACVRVVAAIHNALATGRAGSSDARSLGRGDHDDGEVATTASPEAVRRRVALFARFLGVRGDDRPPPLPDTAAVMFLTALLLLQQGAAPLLPLSGERVTVDCGALLAVLDRVFAGAPSVVRERVKTTAAERFAEMGQADAEAALEYAAEEWTDLHRRREARLHALFQSLCLGSAIDLHQFEQVGSV